MRDLKIGEYKEVNGGTKNGGTTSTGETITCADGSAPHLGGHRDGSRQKPHCHSISDLPTTGGPGKPGGQNEEPGKEGANPPGENR